MDYIETEMITSLATIVLVILCIAVFIAYGAHLAFYAGWPNGRVAMETAKRLFERDDASAS